MSYQPINHWPISDRPREKLIKYGERSLSDSELLAILLRTGVQGQSAMDVARRLMGQVKTFRQMSSMNDVDWIGIKGVGPAKIAQIKAALEIGRRFREQEVREELVKINSSADMADILMPQMRDLKVEVFKVAYLDNQNRLIQIVDQDQGTVNQTTPFIREILKGALEKYALSIVCIHNHPSGLVRPSDQDRHFTRKLADVSRAMEVQLLDHIIIGDGDYFSFADEGML